jgi:hypothetical protein
LTQQKKTNFIRTTVVLKRETILHENTDGFALDTKSRHQIKSTSHSVADEKEVATELEWRNLLD